MNERTSRADERARINLDAVSLKRHADNMLSSFDPYAKFLATKRLMAMVKAEYLVHELVTTGCDLGATMVLASENNVEINIGTSQTLEVYDTVALQVSFDEPGNKSALTTWVNFDGVTNEAAGLPDEKIRAVQKQIFRIAEEWEGETDYIEAALDKRFSIFENNLGRSLSTAKKRVLSDDHERLIEVLKKQEEVGAREIKTQKKRGWLSTL